MKIPPGAIIPRAKLIQYLLVFQKQNDKSEFLASGGFTTENPYKLETAIRQMIAENDAEESFTDKFGTRYTVTGMLRGANNVNLGVVTVWIVRTEETIYRFITLRPL